MQLRNQIEETFGAALFERPLFYSYPNGLRFELSEGATYIEQFLAALQKAVIVSNDVFAESESFVLCLQTYMGEGTQAYRGILRQLRIAQISVSEDRQVWSQPVSPNWADEDETGSMISLAFTVPIALLKNALWCALAAELSIRPSLECSVYLLNLRAGVAIFPYDDRGMDVVGPNIEVLRSLFAKHQTFLLPYDLAEMQSNFGAL